MVRVAHALAVAMAMTLNMSCDLFLSILESNSETAFQMLHYLPSSVSEHGHNVNNLSMQGAYRLLHFRTAIHPGYKQRWWSEVSLKSMVVQDGLISPYQILHRAMAPPPLLTSTASWLVAQMTFGVLSRTVWSSCMSLLTFSITTLSLASSLQTLKRFNTSTPILLTLTPSSTTPSIRKSISSRHWPR